jgi:hypothetical protein
MMNVARISLAELQEIIAAGDRAWLKVRGRRLLVDLGTHEISVAPLERKVQRVRVYVAGAGVPDLPLPPYTRKGEQPEVDAAWRKYNQAEIKLERAVIDDVRKRYGLDLGKLSFSRTAGCSCKCSPGFISNINASLQIYVTKK